MFTKFPLDGGARRCYNSRVKNANRQTEKDKPMATVDKRIADTIRDGNGYYKDDSRVWRIVEYDNAFGGVGYGLEYAGQLGRYAESPFVRNPRVYWEAKD